ncbi:nickel-dependent hydrogenase large subunit [Dehalobacter restrictus]|uniref:Hyaluronate lyase n=1 Tax=Dehalobacter restrictus TaxID=55583 RepID=A0A857DFW3_9FIRM|nr:nickel-dependent hydrogenase large subunit [Dehalobacter restrictus]QHA00174.1 hyaluronate lyase [Dehalobacter restrictus]
MKKIVIGPLTRANNSCAVEVTVENKKVIDAHCSGIFFRGFELILQGKDPRDAAYLTERICGICSSLHGAAASYALEDAAGIKPPRNANILRNLIIGADILQNHVRHLYLFSLVDYLVLPERAPFVPGYTKDKRLEKKKNDTMVQNMHLALEVSRLAHEMVALLGGKAPFPHGILAGGATVPPSTDVVMNFRSKLQKVNRFIQNQMVSDVYILADAYSDYFELGQRAPNMLEYGLFPCTEQDQERYFPGGAVLNGQIQKLDLSLIKEHTARSWYAAESGPRNPSGGRTVPEREKEDAYSWIKAPRYSGVPLEGGPLARLWIKGDYRKGTSTMDRMIARALEAQKVGALMESWLDELEPEGRIFLPFEVPKNAEGIGITGAMRGPLGHWLRIENGRIAQYQIITPSAWNFSPRDNQNCRGPVEEALIGIPIADEKQPIEIGRVIRAFDICSSCSTHLITMGKPVGEMII